MHSMEWARNAMLACIVVALVMARVSAVRMAREVNRRASPDGQISMKWWPNYKDRQVVKRYRFAIPEGHLHFIYIACMVGAFMFLVAGVLLGVHSI